MNKRIINRVKEEGKCMIDTGKTVREIASIFGVSKSTVHKDVAERLLDIDPGLARQARIVLDINKSERHIRGGMATKEKYLHQHMLHAFMAKS